MAKKNGKLDVIKVILAPLYELGNTPSKIAKELERRGIQGIKEDGSSCPLANVLQAHYREGVLVGRDEIEINGVTLSTPDVFAEFVSRFDGGDFPNLDEAYEEGE